MENKKILEETPLVNDPSPQVVQGVVMGTTAGKRITSDETIADRPVRKNFVQIVFVLLAVMALATVLGMWFVHSVHPKMGGDTTGKPTTSDEASPKGKGAPQ